MTNEEREQERRRIVAAVPVLEHQAEAAQRALDGVDETIAKFEGLVKYAKAQRGPAKDALRDAQTELEEARRRANEVLAEGPVTLSTGVVHAQADAASVAGGVN